MKNLAVKVGFSYSFAHSFSQGASSALHRASFSPSSLPERGRRDEGNHHPSDQKSGNRAGNEGSDQYPVPDLAG